MLPLAVHDVGPAWQHTGGLLPLPRASDRGQTNGRSLGLIILRLVSHSTPTLSCMRPVAIVPEEYGGIRLPVNYKRLNSINIPDCSPPPGHMESWMFSLFELVASFHQTTIHKDPIPPAAFCTPTRLFRAACHATREQHSTRMVRQGYQRGH